MMTYKRGTRASLFFFCQLFIDGDTPYSMLGVDHV